MNFKMRTITASFIIAASATMATPAIASAAPSPQVVIRQDVPTIDKTSPMQVAGGFYVQVLRAPSGQQGTVAFEAKDKSAMLSTGSYVVLPMENCTCSPEFDVSGQVYLDNNVVVRAVVTIGGKTYRSDWFVPTYA
jgi:hypothetical protein